jgi:hypothetical protein
MAFRLLFYTTTPGADILALARYMSNLPDTEVCILVPDTKTFLAEPVHQLFPLKARVVSHRLRHHVLGVTGFKPHLTIMDNHLPLRRLSPKALMLWHGYGWKGPNDRNEFAWLHRQMRLTWGDMEKPNPNMRWLCFGEPDFIHRTQISGFHPENCFIGGSMIHDLLRNSVPKEKLQSAYPFDVIHRKTILFAPTWHYGEVFSHWDADAVILQELFDFAEARQTNLVFRLHDRHRYPPAYIAQLEKWTAGRAGVLLKFKDAAPDNFLDMQVADVLLTNFSSIACLFYATRKPSVQIYPVKNADEAFLWRRQTIAGQISTTVPKARFIWKYPPEDQGGLLARSKKEMFDHLERALAEPECCRQISEAYLQKHMLQAPEGNLKNLAGFLRNWAY